MGCGYFEHDHTRFTDEDNGFPNDRLKACKVLRIKARLDVMDTPTRIFMDGHHER